MINGPDFWYVIDYLFLGIIGAVVIIVALFSLIDLLRRNTR